MKKLFALGALIGLIVGFLVSEPMIKGLGKAMAGVFFILWFIWYVLAKEPVEKSGH